MKESCCNCGRKVSRNEARYRFCQITICLDCGREPFEKLKGACFSIKGCHGAPADWKGCPAHKSVADALKRPQKRPDEPPPPPSTP